MLKVGDKLLCKKTMFDYRFFKYYNMVEGKYYEISKIFDNIIYFSADSYSLHKNSFYYIWNFFYKPQEMRKMKLERLKQC